MRATPTALAMLNAALASSTLVSAAPRFIPRFILDEEDVVLIARNPYPQDDVEQVTSGSAAPPPYPTLTNANNNDDNAGHSTARTENNNVNLPANPPATTTTDTEAVTSGSIINNSYPAHTSATPVSGTAGVVSNASINPLETLGVTETANPDGAPTGFLSNKAMAGGVFAGVAVLILFLLFAFWLCYKRSSRVLKNEKAIAYTNEKPAPPSFFTRLFSRGKGNKRVRIVSFTSSFDAATPGSEDRWSTFSGRERNDPFSSNPNMERPPPAMTQQRLSTQPSAVTIVSPSESSSRRSLVGIEYADLIREESTPRATTAQLPLLRTTLMSVDEPESPYIQTPTSKHSAGSAYMNMTVGPRAVEAAIRAHQEEIDRQIVTPEVPSRGPSPYQMQLPMVTGSNTTLVGSQRTFGGEKKTKQRSSILLQNPFLSAAEVESSVGHGADSIYDRHFFQSELKPEDEGRDCDASSVEIVPGLHRNASGRSAASDASSSFWYNENTGTSDGSRTIRNSASTTASNPFALEIDEILGTKDGVQAVRWPSPPMLTASATGGAQRPREWV